MNSNKIFILVYLTLFAALTVNAEMNVPIQLKLKSPTGNYPTETGLSFKLLILSPISGCILREETFSGQSVSNGNISLSLGSGVRGLNDPSLTLNQVYDNSKSKSGLACVDSGNNVISTGQVYIPLAGDARVIRVMTNIQNEPILVNFNMRATPYAIQAESVGGKSAADIVVNDSTTQMNQTNLNDLLLNVSRFNNLKNIALTGQAASAALAAGFTGALAGDVTGIQGATSVDRLKGVAVSATAPTAGQVLQYNGTQYVPTTIVSGGVASVAGKTGVVTLVSADISGLGNSAALSVGTTAGTVAAGDDSRIVNALQPSSAFSGDVSGVASAITVDKVRNVAVSATAPTAGQALVYDGTQWVPTTGFPTFARKIANETFSTTLATNVASLAFPVVAGATYKYKFTIMYTSAATTTGLKLGLTYPAVTSASAAAEIASGVDGTGAYFQGVINTSGDVVTATSSAAAASVLVAFVEGIIVPAAAGNVQLTAASEVNASNIVILAGSFVEIVIIP